MSSGRFIPQPVGNPNNVTTINDNFDNIATALDNVLSRFNDLPNAMQTPLDMNGYPILNQSNPVILTSFNWLGNWTTGIMYNEGDAVFFNSTSYLCVIANTAGVSFLDDLLATKWTKIDLGTIYQGTWTASTDYFIGDTIVNANQFYVCLTDHESGLTFNSSFWRTYGAFGSMAAQNSNAISVTGGTMAGVTVPDPVSSTQIANKEYVDNASATAGVTGDIKMTYNPAQPADWIQMNDGSVGNSGSGASYANSNAFNLFALWWGYSTTWFPFIDGSSRGGSALADWNANKAIMMPATVGRAFANFGTGTLNQVFTASSGTDLITVPSTSSLYTGTLITVSNSGGALPAPLVAATPYYAVNISGTTIKLATTRANANLGTVINLTTNGSGTNTVTVNYQAYVVGQILGEETHQNIASELAAHTHMMYQNLTVLASNGADEGLSAGTSSSSNNNYTSGTQGTASGSGSTPAITDQPHNNIQPTTFAMVFVHI